ncbi:MAG: methyltransferase [Hyphomicrobiales bacterium]|nr:methyltransferase [Hyphomicrobiales bacterium]
MDRQGRGVTYEELLDTMEAINRKPGSMDQKIKTWTALLASFRQRQLMAHLVATGGWRVQGGPFRGMRLDDTYLVPPHLLGGYEASLHPAMEAAVARGYGQIVNIGCSFGYYAIGLARRCPRARVAAHDIDAAALESCRRLAGLNGVADRLSFGGEVTHGDFATWPAGDTLIICDIEGGERDLLDPAAAPALLGFDLVVEIHQDPEEGTRALIESRFAATHDVRFVGNDRVQAEIPAAFWGADSLDQAILAWECRGSATPWLVLTRRDGEP